MRTAGTVSVLSGYRENLIPSDGAVSHPPANQFISIQKLLYFGKLTNRVGIM